LNEAVDVIVHEEKRFKLVEAPQLADVSRRNNIVKAHVLERDLLNSLLEVCVV